MSWIAIAFIAPALWALVALLDTYFIDGIYRDATDGAIISGLFQGLPWVLVPLGLIDFDYPGHRIAAYAIAVNCPATRSTRRSPKSATRPLAWG